jgi:hypothetical protein
MNEKNRLFVVLQKNDDNSVELTGIFTTNEMAQKVKENWVKQYDEPCWVESAVLDFDYQSWKQL